MPVLKVLMLVANELVVVAAILALLRGGRLERIFGLLLLLSSFFRGVLRGLCEVGEPLSWAPFLVFSGAIAAVMAWTALRHRSLWAGAVFVSYSVTAGLAVAALVNGAPRANVVAEALLRIAGSLCLGGAALWAWLGPPRAPPSGRDADLLAAAR